MPAQENRSWYRTREYAHFDLPVSFESAQKYVSQPETVQRHAFLPFLSFEIRTRRFGRPEPKIRPIRYASHRDSNVFAYYASILSTKYESLLAESELSKVVLAYRARLGNNVTFARDAFNDIAASASCVAIGFDIASFFDSLDHQLLKARWLELLDVDTLPADHYAVFKAITKYSWVDRDSCYRRLGYNKHSRRTKRPICPINVFRTVIKGRDGANQSLVERNLASHGIPQGSPISAILANLYLLPFDERMVQLAQHVGGTYRRYSDDILWIAPLEAESLIKETVAQEISALKLSIQPEKTTTSHFLRAADQTAVLHTGDKPFQYLGFTFDGKRRLLRAQTLSRFWRKAVRAVRKAKADARAAQERGRAGGVFKRGLYRRFTHLGRNNFITYARRSSQLMHADDQAAWTRTTVWRQVKNHGEKLQRLLAEP